MKSFIQRMTKKNERSRRDYHLYDLTNDLFNKVSINVDLFIEIKIFDSKLK